MSNKSQIQNQLKKNQPKVSVCVQTYQHSNYIRRCLDGILAQQTNFEFEILVGEDDSTDGTREICKAYAKDHSDRIRLFLLDRKNVIYINGKPTGRYNFLHNLKASSGKYIAVCEGDDYWTDPHKLQKQFDFLESKSDYVGCYHNVRLADSDGTLLDQWKIPPKVIQQQDPSDFWTRLNVPVLSVMFRKSAMFYPPALYTVYNCDTFLLCMIGKSGKFRYLPEISDAVAHIHQGGVWSSLNQIQKIQVRNMTLTSLLDIVEPEFRAELKQYLARQYARLIKLSLKHLQFHSALRAVYQFGRIQHFRPDHIFRSVIALPSTRL